MSKILKHLINFNESSRFLEMFEVIEYIKDICIDILDYDIIPEFGTIILLGGDKFGYTNGINDINIKLASIGKQVLCFKLDISRPPSRGHQFLLNKLKDDSKVDVSNTITTVSNYLENMGFIIAGFWYKQFDQQYFRGYRGANYYKVETVKDINRYVLSGEAVEIIIAFKGEPILED